MIKVEGMACVDEGELKQQVTAKQEMALKNMRIGLAEDEIKKGLGENAIIIEMWNTREWERHPQHSYIFCCMVYANVEVFE